MGKTPLNIGEELARTRIRKYCDYRERNHREVRDKLYSMGLYPQQVEKMITELVEEDVLNEERYAGVFVRGKFRIKQWGKAKIIYELKQQQISAYCIKKAITQIDEEEYFATLTALALKKLELLRKEKNNLIKKQKLYRCLTQKGYESQHIQKVINQII